MKSNRENKVDRNCKLFSFPHSVKESSLSLCLSPSLDFLVVEDTYSANGIVKYRNKVERKNNYNKSRNGNCGYEFDRDSLRSFKNTRCFVLAGKKKRNSKAVHT